MKVFENKIVEVVEINSFLVEDKITAASLAVIAAINNVSLEDIIIDTGEDEHGNRRAQVTINKVIEVEPA